MTASAVHGLVRQEQFFTKRVAAKDTSTYFVVEPGDLVYSKSTSKEAPYGAILRHSGSEAGVVTPLYIVFRAKRDVVNPEFLRLACNSGVFFDSLRQSLREGARTHGLMNVRLDEFFSSAVPVPDMPTQLRVVEILTAAEDVVDASRRELAAALTALRGLRDECFETLWATEHTNELDDVVQEIKRPIEVHRDEPYDQIGVRSHGRGVFTKESVTGGELGNKKVFWVEPGDLVINIVFAWEGAVALVPDAVSGHCASHRFPTYRRPDGGPIDYVRHALLSARGVELMGLASPGGAGRNRTLNRKRLGASCIPLPPVDRQQEIAEALTAFEEHVASAEMAVGSALRAKNALLASVFGQTTRLDADEPTSLAAVTG